MLLAAQQAQQNPALGEFIFSVGSGLTVLLLGYLARMIRKFMKEHEWLIETVNKNSKAIETQGKAIEDLLKERRRDRLPEVSRPRRGRT